MANYWIKTYIEILDDPKMATLPDRLWRRIMEVFLLAGKFHGDGQLPETKQLAWVLRMTTDDLDLDMRQIEQTGIIRRNSEGWLVVNFAKRQSATPGAERKRQYKQRQHVDQYYGNESGNETLPRAERNVTQINRLTEADTDTESPAPAAPNYSIPNILARASGLTTVPPKESARLEQIQCLIDAYGPERVEGALKSAVQDWVGRRTKENKPYSLLNMAWVDKAQEALDNGGGVARVTTRRQWDDLPYDDRMAWLKAGKEIPV